MTQVEVRETLQLDRKQVEQCKPLRGDGHTSHAVQLNNFVSC